MITRADEIDFLSELKTPFDLSDGILNVFAGVEKTVTHGRSNVNGDLPAGFIECGKSDYEFVDTCSGRSRERRPIELFAGLPDRSCPQFKVASPPAAFC